MAANGKHRIFLASSAELRADRDAFRLFVGDLNKRWHDRGIFLEVTVWEDFDDAMSPTRKQDDYNDALRQCDLFVMLFWTKVGMYTAEEFEAAYVQFKATGLPRIYTYFKNVPVLIGATNRRDTTSLWDFQDRLKALGHFQTEYDSVAALNGHFGQQLEKLAADGFFGSGASGDASAVPVASGPIQAGPRIDTGGGAYVGGNVTVTNGSFVGRDLLGRPDKP